MDNYERAFWLSAGWDAAMAGTPREAVNFLRPNMVHERKVWLQGWESATLQKQNDCAKIDQELEKETTMGMALDEREFALWEGKGMASAALGKSRSMGETIDDQEKRRAWYEGYDEQMVSSTPAESINENGHVAILPDEQWGIVELMGRKVVAGRISKSEMLGVSLMRVDVPETKNYPAYTAFYSDKALYGVTFVSEEVARRTAESVSANPVSVYVPDLVTREAYDEIKARWEQTQEEIYRLKRLPAGDTCNPPAQEHDQDDSEGEDEGMIPDGSNELPGE
jgi:ribosome modulation factor